ncbi:hypothetical protein [Thaumasiovibrio sp. DFM-14]|uniref:hypothetical protein n=1 Tax=Thaumasiovibrio sp. DFM-14 TaxID=3384792 RepID=UPI0039A241D3
MYAALLIVISIFLSILGVFSLGIIDGDIPALVLAIPAVWLLPQGGAAAWLLLLSLGTYGLTLDSQPLSISIGVWMVMPVLDVTFSRKGNWQLGILMTVIVLAMYGGLMALQRDGKLDGEAFFTVVQLVGVVGVWCAARCWRMVKGNTWWPIAIMLPLWLTGGAHASLIGLCVVGLIASMQSMAKTEQSEYLERLVWILPAVTFAALVVTPRFPVPNAVLVCWLLVLCSAWLGEYLLDDPEEDF